MARKTCSGCFYFSFSPRTQQSIKERVLICSFPVIFVSTTITPAPAISGCPPSDRNSCAFCLSRRTALLMAQDSDWWHCSQKTRPRGQSVVCLQKLFFFPGKKVYPVSVFKRGFRLVLPCYREMDYKFLDSEDLYLLILFICVICNYI